MSRLRRVLRWALPALISGGTLAFLLTQIDFVEALGHVDAGVALVLVPALLLYGLLSLWLEALSLVRVLPPESGPLMKSVCRITSMTTPRRG